MFAKFKAQLRRNKLRKLGIEPTTQRNDQILFLGERSGVWPVLDSTLKNKNLTVYSFGLGNNISWELDLISRYDVKVFAFDPTPASVDWLAEQKLPQTLHFQAIGLADYCGELSFYIPRRLGRFNYSVVNRGGKYPDQTINCQVKDLATLCEENHHKHIDILKLDIEGSEMSALPNILDSGISIDKLLIEFHYNYKGISYSDTIALIQRLQSLGYELFWLSYRAYEFGFIRR